MKQEHVNPFLIPVQTLWHEEFACPLKVKDAKAVSHQYTTDDVTAIVGISGSLNGNVLYCFSEELVANIVKHLVGVDAAVRAPEAMSALSDIASRITSEAADRLVGSGYACEISPPIVLEPVGATLTASAPKQVQVTFESDIGALRVRLGLVAKAEEATEEAIEEVADEEERAA